MRISKKLKLATYSCNMEIIITDNLPLEVDKI